MKKGFTLAEVLITLGVIGVVAAMTLPSLINNKQNKELEAALKKNYTVINQALDMYQAEYGERISKSNSNSALLKQSLMKYMKMAADCGNSDLYQPYQKCIPRVNGGSGGTIFGQGYMNLNNTASIGWGYWNDGQFMLYDGSFIFIDIAFYISVDVNGVYKKPNQLGQDVFMFQIDDSGKLLPMGAKGTKFYSDTDEYCSKTSTSDLNGAGCTVKALTDKNYFKNLP